MISFGADVVATSIVASIERAGGESLRIRLDDYEDPGGIVAAEACLRRSLASVTASVFVAPPGGPSHLSVLALRAASSRKLRHLHMPGVTPRILGQSVAADPDALATIGAKIAARLAPPVTLRARGPAGTDLTIELDARYPVLTRTGRVRDGESDNLPSGFVAAHPARVSGIYVADRGLVGSGFRVPSDAVVRDPVALEIEGGRIAAVRSRDPRLLEEIERYRGLHPNADRVSLVIIPGNPRVTAPIGCDVQDALLPGLNLLFGFSLRASSHAEFDAPCQMRAHASGLDVESDLGPLVSAGTLVV